MSLLGATGSMGTRTFPSVPAAVPSLENTSVATAPLQCFDVLPALFTNIRSYLCTASKYVRAFLTNVVSSHLIFGQGWNGSFFEPTSLKDLGYCFYIGHQHMPCPSPGSTTQAMLVIDVNGLHHVDVQFCDCEETPGWVEKYRQLLRIEWYPASFHRPKTVFTFDVLDTYHGLSIQGKLNLYDYHSSLQQKTDNCGRKKVAVSMFLLYEGPRADTYGHRIDTVK